jgi:hypothetical protein
MDKIKDKIKDFIFDKKQLPLYNYNDIPNTLTYQYGSDIGIINCHLGQRKLLLTEIEFYNKCVKDKNNLIIYAGSASCEHLPVILKLFPTLKFILIDPFYHSINGYYEYIYQNVDNLDKGNLQQFRNQLKKTDNQRFKHLHYNALRLLKTHFIYDTNTYNVLNKDEKMKEFMDDFYNNKLDVINHIMKSDKRVFIIQDYLTIELTKKLKSYCNDSINLYFITDIRTTLINNEATDLDIIWNSALQIIFLKILLPKYSMLKFRTPFYNTYDDVLKYLKDNSDSFIFKDLEYAKKLCNVDLLKNYINKQYLYFNNDIIYTQAWAPIHSSETRLVISLDNINQPLIKYDNSKWENKFFFYRFIRYYKFYPIFYEKIKNIEKLHYDGCQDCARELMILLEYIGKSSKNFNYDLPKLSLLLDNEENIKELIKIYNLINEFTFFRLDKNFKCEHGRIKEFKSEIVFEKKIEFKKKLY